MDDRGICPFLEVCSQIYKYINICLIKYLNLKHPNKVNIHLKKMNIKERK